MTDPKTAECFVIGSFQLDAEQRILTRDGSIVPLAPKAVDVLITLARSRGDVVSKDELFSAVWPDTWVDDSALAKVVYTLRRELGTLPDGQPLIETIPKRGYRLAADVHMAGDAPGRPERAIGEAESGDRSSRASRVLRIAIGVTFAALAVVAVVALRTSRETVTSRIDLLVMPFNAGASAEAETVARGVGDFLATRLAGVPGLSVIAPSLATGNSPSGPVEMAKRLGADVVLTGVVSINDGTIRVTYQLIRVDDRRLLGGDSLDSTTSDIFEMEERVASWIATSLRLQQSLRRTSDKALGTPDRQQAYIRAIGCLRPNTPQPKVEQALTLLHSLDPEGQSSPWVLTALGRAHLDEFVLSEDPASLELAGKYVARAARLDPEHPRVRALAGAIHRARGEFDSAVTELRAALLLEPDATDVLLDLATLYGEMGRQADAGATFEYLLDVHPRCAFCMSRLGRFHSQNGRLDQAIQSYQRAIELAPDAASFYASLGGVYIRQSRYSEAVPVLETAIRISPSAISYSNLGYCEYLSGDLDAAVRYFGAAVELSPNSFLYRGNLGDALRFLPDRGAEADAEFDRAIELANASLETNPNDALTRALLAEYLAKRGAIEAANIEIARAMTEAAPDAADIYLCAAIVRMISNDRESAVGFLGRAMEAGLTPSIVENDPQFASLRGHPGFPKSR